ncbi:septal ring lytic transglycosylase RlpA family protein [Entomomonas sp. E2T0]|uniref:septal ring lytic transglycosylase RlpA family protein n=1 Tax=Entomomonas sp. E2T0 TaxID=2930213 RepID=UPI0029D40FA2|nr:septal ring lytic transglycosylase RlpA family protein [Entomomonas sp. E2T0]
MTKLLQIAQLTTVSGLILLLIGCQSNDTTDDDSYQKVAKTSHSGQYVRPLKDGAPWWDVDVSNIPDATPTPHTGAYKKNPYTVLGKTYYPKSSATGYKEVGMASWYGTKFHGQATANGEPYDLYGMTAAHKTLPLPSYVKVTNLENNRSVILRVNDRGPFHSDRIIDLSFAAAKKLGYADTGTAKVRVESIDPQQWGNNKNSTVAQQKPQTSLTVTTQPVDNAPVSEYQPPANQHATADSNNPQKGLYLQVGAFANPDAAELLRQRLVKVTDVPVFISSVLHGAQQLYRVRLGPLPNQHETFKTQEAIRVANLGQSTLVKQD